MGALFVWPCYSFIYKALCEKETSTEVLWDGVGL